MNNCKLLAIVLVLFSAMIALAGTTGSISVIVTDPSGAVIRNVQVTAFLF